MTHVIGGLPPKETAARLGQFASPRHLGIVAGAILSGVSISLALWTIYSVAQRIAINDVFTSARALSPGAIVLALCLTVASYVLVTVYDVIALRHIARPVAYARAALASFLGSAFGNNLGFSVVTSASVRYRIYAPAGLSAIEIAAVSTMCTYTAVLGMITILAIAMIFGEGAVTDAAIHVPVALRRFFGILILVGLGWLLWTTRHRSITLHNRYWPIRFPSAKVTLVQILLGTTDVLLVGTIVYLLLPTTSATDYLSFLGVIVLAMMAGGISHVPGGIGVFESVLLLGLPQVSSAAVLGAALLFRCIYYLTPLSVAAVGFAVHEAVLQRQHIRLAHGRVLAWLAEFGPQLMAVIIAFGGVVLLFTGVLHATHAQHLLVAGYIPLPVLELAHLAAAAAGFALIALGRGLSRRVDAAYHLAVVFLSVGLVASAIRDFSLWLPLMLAAMLLLIGPTHVEFRRPAALRDEGLPFEWASTLAAVLTVMVWLGFFNYRHMPYAVGLWLTFDYTGDYSRYLRSVLLVLGLSALFAGYLMRRIRYVRETLRADDRARLDAIISVSNEARAQTVWRANRCFLLSETGHAVLPYERRGRLWISVGDPLGDAAEFPELIARFRAAGTAAVAVPVFYSVGEQHHAIYRMHGFSLVKIADDIWVDLHALNTGGALGALRDSAQFPLSQWALEVLLPAQAASYREQFKELYTSGAADDAEIESVAQGAEEFLARLPIAVLRDRDGIVAFCALAENQDRKELAMAALYCDASASEGVTEFLQLSLMERAKAGGYHRFHLGQTLLAPEAMEPPAPLSFIEKRLYCRNGYLGAQHLPGWTQQLPLQQRARYLAYPPGVAIHQVLRAAAALEQDNF